MRRICLFGLMAVNLALDEKERARVTNPTRFRSRRHIRISSNSKCTSQSLIASLNLHHAFAQGVQHIKARYTKYEHPPRS